MPETTYPTHPTHRVRVPKMMYGTKNEAIAYWRESAELEGHVPTGPLEVTEEAATEEECPFAGETCWEVVGEVAAKVPRGPLPVFVPSAEAVEAAARAIGKALDSLDWDTARAPIKNYYLRVALDAINASAQRLIADAAGHVADHASYYGAAALIGQPQLRDLSTDLRKRLNDGTDH